MPQTYLKNGSSKTKTDSTPPLLEGAGGEAKLQIMKTSKIILGFRRLSDDQLEGQALAIAAAMTGNANFPEPTPALADLNNSIKLFSDALALAKTRDKVKVAIKNKCRQNLELLLISLASHCSYTAKADRSILASSGFALNTESNMARPLTPPENFTVQPGNHSGEVLLYVNTVPNAKTYLFLYGLSTMSNEAWFVAVNSLPYFTITGLTPGNTYSFKIGAAGSKGQVLYTNVVSTIVI